MLWRGWQNVFLPKSQPQNYESNQKSELMERASTDHLYTSTLPLTCDGEDKSTRVETER
jgi:hypothetical protein